MSMPLRRIGKSLACHRVMTVRRIVLAFVAGALAVLVFHQPVLWLLHAAHVTPAVPYRLQPTRPFGVPQVWSLAFWGGLWGIVLAAVVSSVRHRWMAASLFGAVVPSLVAWFVVMPLKGQPAGAGWAGPMIVTALLVNAAWGFGTVLLLDLFSTPVHRRVAL